jgi:RES domain-containing protein
VLFETAELDRLAGWEATPPGGGSIEFGMDFLRSARALGLIVPSVIVPEARNLILNPLHPRFAEVVLNIERPFVFDHRLRPSGL